MERLVYHLDVAAPPEGVWVWELIADHDRMAEWSSLRVSRRVRDGSPDVRGVGAVRRVGGPLTFDEEILEFEPPRRLGYRVLDGWYVPFDRHRGEFSIAGIGARCRLHWWLCFRPRLPGLRRATTRGIDRMCAGFARQIRDEAERRARSGSQTR